MSKAKSEKAVLPRLIEVLEETNSLLALLADSVDRLANYWGEAIERAKGATAKKS